MAVPPAPGTGAGSTRASAGESTAGRLDADGRTEPAARAPDPARAPRAASLEAAAASRRLARLARLGWSVSPLALASGLSMLNSAVIAVLFAQLAGPRAYGVYQLDFAVGGVVALLALSGSATAATRAAAQGRSAAWPLFRARLPFAAAAAGVLGLVALVLASLGRGELAAATGALAAVLPLFVGGDVLGGQLIGERRYRAYLGLQAVVQSGTAIAVLVALLVAAGEPWLAVLGVAGLTGAVQLLGLRRLRPGAATGDDRRYARRLTLVAALTAVDVRLDLLVTGMLLGAREAGIVAVAVTFPTIVKRVWEVLYQPFFVEMSADPARAPALVRRARLLLALGLAGISGALALLAPLLVPALFGDAFGDAVALAQLLLAAAALMPLGFLDEVYLKAKGDVGRLGVVYLVLPGVSFVALPPLVYLLGIDGIGVEAIVVAVVYVALVRALARASAREDTVS